MPNIDDLQTAIARAHVDTPRTKITVAIVSRVLKVMGEVLTARHDLIPVVERIINKARRNSVD